MFAIGGVGGFYIGKSVGFWENFRQSSKYQHDLEAYLLHGEVLMAHSERAFNAYIKEKPEIGIWALKGLIPELQILSTESTNKTIISQEDISLDLTLAYARLSKLYSKIGDQINANVCHEKALHYASKTGKYSSKLTNISEIMDFTEKIDKRMLKENKKI